MEWHERFGTEKVWTTSTESAAQGPTSSPLQIVWAEGNPALSVFGCSLVMVGLLLAFVCALPARTIRQAARAP